jgi:deoxyribodipyrimidine photolyase-related protein
VALYADGGRFTSKSFVASGAYFGRMSNYCRACAYRPGQRAVEKTCAFTVLYWRLIDRQVDALTCNPRTSLMVISRDRIDPAELRSIRRRIDSSRTLTPHDSERRIPVMHGCQSAPSCGRNKSEPFR